MSFTSGNAQSALDEAIKVVKRQKLCDTKSESCIDRLIELVRSSQIQLESNESLDADKVMATLRQQAQKLGTSKELASQTKELHLGITRLSKALDKCFDQQVDVCKAMRDCSFDTAALHKVLAEHFYHEGRMDAGDVFVTEAGVPGGALLHQRYAALHGVMRQLREHNVEPALGWAVTHRAQLSNDGSPSSFEFKLHSLSFLHTLRHLGHGPALAYSRSHFGPFQHRHMGEIQRLMGCLLFSRRLAAGAADGVTVGAGPYADLLAAPTLWEQAAQGFWQTACGLLGQASESPLTVTVAAGSAALPELLKLACVMERTCTLQDLQTCEQLPMELELGSEFAFHSIFACPVSREQSSAENPPMLLPCGHVLCEQSVARIAKARVRAFKCPYCPMEARPDALRQLTFPDVQ
ncbi:MAG: hypothetical protein WDW36_001130 [Sanguina aurantia]